MRMEKGRGKENMDDLCYEWYEWKDRKWHIDGRQNEMKNNRLHNMGEEQADNEAAIV